MAAGTGPIERLIRRQSGPGSDDAPLSFALTYLDAEDFLRDCREELQTGRVFLSNQADGTSGAAVCLALSFPGLRAPITLDGTVDEVVRKKKGAMPGMAVALSEKARTELDEVATQIAAHDPARVVRTVRVLLVEDNLHSAQLIEEGLHLASRRNFDGKIAFHVPVAATTADAVAFLDKKPIDALITDVYLGGSSGTDLIERVRTDPALDDIPVIAISAGHDEHTRQAVMSAGANLFLQKPLRIRSLVKAISEALELGAGDAG
ncbi:response regulator [Haliangium sp.]|uniref:response regulator n=1 Tax=Haliangium sp. TaxID=2663208 RepID=UPI003D0A3D27